MTDGAPTGTAGLVTTSARVAAGVLTAAAWDLLRAAPVVLCADPAPDAHPLRAAGVTLSPVHGATDDHASALAAALVDTPGALWWHGNADPAEMVTALRERRIDVLIVEGAPDLPGGHLIDLVRVMDRLRSPGGCPWDARQTHASLLTYLVEEAYEVVEAVERCEPGALAEELGDLLLQVVFHARVAAETDPSDGGFDIDDVADGIVAKLVARHPHVFAGASLDGLGAEEVEKRWHEAKQVEKGRTSALDGVPPGLPALARATKVLARVRRAGLHVPLPDDDTPGSRLLRLAAEISGDGTDPEAELRAAVRSLEAVARTREQASRRADVRTPRAAPTAG